MCKHNSNYACEFLEFWSPINQAIDKNSSFILFLFNSNNIVKINIKNFICNFDIER